MLKHGVNIPRHWASTCRCFLINIDGNDSPTSELLNGSLSPGNGCRIRCVSDLLYAAEVTRINSARCYTRLGLGCQGDRGDLVTGFGFCVLREKSCGSAPKQGTQFPLLTSKEAASPRPGHLQDSHAHSGSLATHFIYGEEVQPLTVQKYNIDKVTPGC